MFYPDLGQNNGRRIADRARWKSITIHSLLHTFQLTDGEEDSMDWAGTQSTTLMEGYWVTAGVQDPKLTDSRARFYTAQSTQLKLMCRLVCLND